MMSPYANPKSPETILSDARWRTRQALTAYREGRLDEAEHYAGYAKGLLSALTDRDVANHRVSWPWVLTIDHPVAEWTPEDIDLLERIGGPAEVPSANPGDECAILRAEAARLTEEVARRDLVGDADLDGARAFLDEEPPVVPARFAEVAPVWEMSYAAQRREKDMEREVEECRRALGRSNPEWTPLEQVSPGRWEATFLPDPLHLHVFEHAEDEYYWEIVDRQGDVMREGTTSSLLGANEAALQAAVRLTPVANPRDRERGRLTAEELERIREMMRARERRERPWRPFLEAEYAPANPDLSPIVVEALRRHGLTPEDLERIERDVDECRRLVIEGRAARRPAGVTLTPEETERFVETLQRCDELIRGVNEILRAGAERAGRHWPPVAAPAENVERLSAEELERWREMMRARRERRERVEWRPGEMEAAPANPRHRGSIASAWDWLEYDDRISIAERAGVSFDRAEMLATSDWRSLAADVKEDILIEYGERPPENPRLTPKEYEAFREVYGRSPPRYVPPEERLRFANPKRRDLSRIALTEIADTAGDLLSEVEEEEMKPFGLHQVLSRIESVALSALRGRANPEGRLEKTEKEVLRLARRAALRGLEADAEGEREERRWARERMAELLTQEEWDDLGRRYPVIWAYVLGVYRPDDELRRRVIEVAAATEYVPPALANPQTAIEISARIYELLDQAEREFEFARGDPDPHRYLDAADLQISGAEELWRFALHPTWDWKQWGEAQSRVHEMRDRLRRAVMDAPPRLRANPGDVDLIGVPVVFRTPWPYEEVAVPDPDDPVGDVLCGRAVVSGRWLVIGLPYMTNEAAENAMLKFVEARQRETKRC